MRQLLLVAVLVPMLASLAGVATVRMRMWTWVVTTSPRTATRS